MFFVLHIFGEPSSHNVKPIIDKRLYSSQNVVEAIDLCDQNLRRHPPYNAHSSCLLDDTGRILKRWTYASA